MWLANRGQGQMQGNSAAQFGQVTVAGSPAGVYLAGERREIPVLAPGGYHWVPRRNDCVLVMKAGAEEENCLVAARGVSTQRLAPGEVWISVHQDAGILLKANGSIHLMGSIFANGRLLSAPEEEDAS